MLNMQLANTPVDTQLATRQFKVGALVMGPHTYWVTYSKKAKFPASGFERGQIIELRNIALFNEFDAATINNLNKQIRKAVKKDRTNNTTNELQALIEGKPSWKPI